MLNRIRPGRWKWRFRSQDLGFRLPPQEIVGAPICTVSTAPPRRSTRPGRRHWPFPPLTTYRSGSGGWLSNPRLADVTMDQGRQAEDGRQGGHQDRAQAHALTKASSVARPSSARTAIAFTVIPCILVE